MLLAKPKAQKITSRTNRLFIWTTCTQCHCFGANWFGLFVAVGNVTNPVNKGRQTGSMSTLFIIRCLWILHASLAKFLYTKLLGPRHGIYIYRGFSPSDTNCPMTS